MKSDGTSRSSGSLSSSSSSCVDRIGHWVDAHARGLSYTFYAVGLGGLALCGRSLHLSTRFTGVAQIPEAYFAQQLRLTGTVQAVQVWTPTSHSENLVFFVVHQPILSFFRRRTGHHPLPVICAALKLEAQPDIQTLGDKAQTLTQSWSGQTIQFRLLKPQALSVKVADESTDAVLALIERKPGLFRRRQNLGVELVALGHAVPAEYRLHLQDSPCYDRYYQELLQAEAVALKKNRGIWLNESPQAGLWSRFWTAVRQRFTKKI
ncbi:protein C3orf33 homolog [Tigriopus californicus]|uniref:protein C3orf33 homolog n=1 Tax=Tigriopus californicus TaxID=6832 RepID=UPI0027DA81F1|nr:protein C3orf33 homolog [Tigriopus californicus]